MKRFIKYLFFLLIFGITCITLVGCKEQEKKQDCNNYNMIVNNVEENGIGLKMTKLATSDSTNYSDYVFYLSSDLKNTLSSYGINCKDDYGIVFDENFNYSFEEMFGELTEVDFFTNEFYLSLFECPKWFELRICDNDDVFANFELLFSFENIEI